MVTKKKGPSKVELAARLYGCDAGDLMAWHEFEDGSVAIIAPTGQKFTYSAGRIHEEQVKLMAQAPVAPKKEKEQEVVDVAELLETCYPELFADDDHGPDKAVVEVEPCADESNEWPAFDLSKAEDGAKCLPELGDNHVVEKAKPARRKRNK